ncbi:YceG-like family protein [Eubacterium ruminantium]|nr:YceG-like family protein [Eubacterium ruminantium]
MAKVRFKKRLGKRAERTLKSAMYYTLELFIDVLIVYFIVRSFSIAFNFTYNVFNDSAKDLGATTYVTVAIEKNASALDISKELYKAGVIKNKYVMAAKLTLGKYTGDIKAGLYKVKASMTYNEIIEHLSGKEITKVGPKENDKKTKKLTTQDTGQATEEVTTEKTEEKTEAKSEDGEDDSDKDDSSDDDSDSDDDSYGGRDDGNDSDSDGGSDESWDDGGDSDSDSDSDEGWDDGGNSDSDSDSDEGWDDGGDSDSDSDSDEGWDDGGDSDDGGNEGSDDEWW